MADSANNIMNFKTMKKDFGQVKKSRRYNSLAPFARTPNSNSYSGKFHDYHLSVNPFETTVFDESVINNMLNEVKETKHLRDEAEGDEELDALLKKLNRFKDASQRYT